MKTTTLGGEELKLLRFIAQRGPLTVGEAAEQFGTVEGLARSTVLTVMARLRSKHYLRRRRVGGVFQYQSTRPVSGLLSEVIGRFVDTALGGSLSPFVAYLAASAELSSNEVKQLEQLLSKAESRGKDRK